MSSVTSVAAAGVVQENITRVRQRIAAAAERAGRPLSSVRLVGVSKTFPAEVVATANPGCMLQLQAGLVRAGLAGRVAHVIELLDESYEAGVERGTTSQEP